MPLNQIRTQMRTPSLFAWLSGITSYHIIYPSSEEKNRALFQEALMKDAHYAQAPLVEVLPTTVSVQVPLYLKIHFRIAFACS